MNTYLRYDSGSHLLGAEDRLSFRFRYCNDHGLLIYQSGGPDTRDFMAVGVHSARVYLEWRTEGSLIEVSATLMILIIINIKDSVEKMSHGAGL